MFKYFIQYKTFFQPVQLDCHLCIPYFSLSEYLGDRTKKRETCCGFSGIFPREPLNDWCRDCFIFFQPFFNDRGRASGSMDERNGRKGHSRWKWLSDSGTVLRSDVALRTDRARERLWSRGNVRVKREEKMRIHVSINVKSIKKRV